MQPEMRKPRLIINKKQPSKPINQAKCGAAARNGQKFEKEVMLFVATDHVATTDWQRYLRSVVTAPIVRVVDVSTERNRSQCGDTTDIIVETTTHQYNLSIKRNNDFLSHPRVASLFDHFRFSSVTINRHTYRTEYSEIKQLFDADANALNNMVYYYKLFAELTQKYLLLVEAKQVFCYLYPTDIHMIRNKGKCEFFPSIDGCPTLNVITERGTGHKGKIGYYVVLKFSNGYVFRLRIHNSAGIKAKHQSNPFKWEVTLTKTPASK